MPVALPRPIGAGARLASGRSALGVSRLADRSCRRENTLVDSACLSDQAGPLEIGFRDKSYDFAQQALQAGDGLYPAHANIVPTRLQRRESWMSHVREGRAADRHGCPARVTAARADGSWRWVETLHSIAGDNRLCACVMTGTGLNVLSFLFLGFFLGMRHATDADHVVAIATIVSRERSMAGSALIGAAWGVGHTMTVMAVGAAIIVFGVVIPPRLGLSMEFAVGIMLVLLGILTLTGMGRTVGAAHAHAGVPAGGHPLDLHDHLHAHGDYVHRHPHGDGPDAHGHAEEHTPLARLDRSGLGRIAFHKWLRPFAVGLVHGLAGSAAAALMVLSIIREPVAALGYLLLFGLGTIVGMMLITLMLSAPFAFTAVNLPKFNWRLRVASGLISFVFGVILIYGIGFAEGGLFTDAPTWDPRWLCQTTDSPCPWLWGRS